ncbi:hypothetical protein SDC9_73655 [bioreactor metagenome]|uniref:DUF5673 domain-containing protein n=1 Tax=bioreactor metagenome TaxID=1076179 RepID=A0A644YGM2_9ZZZZ
MPYTLAVLSVLLCLLACVVSMCGKYFVRRKRTGEILFKLRGSPIMLYEFKVGACIMILVLLYSFWNWRQIPAVLIPYFFHSPSFEFLCLLFFVQFVLLCLPIKVCEHGIVDHTGFIPWDVIEGYARNNDTRVTLRFKRRRWPWKRAEGEILSITHPPELKDRLDAVLNERVGRQQEA